MDSFDYLYCTDKINCMNTFTIIIGAAANLIVLFATFMVYFSLLEAGRQSNRI
jgi:hypothetical protein